MQVHKAQVRGRKIAWDVREVVQHGLNSDVIKLDLDAEWRECDAISVVLCDSSLREPKRFVVNEDRALELPPSMLSETGPFSTCVIGYKGGVRRIVTAQERYPLVVVGSGCTGPLDPGEEQPDLWGQLMSAEAARIEAEFARAKAEQARAIAETGRVEAEATRAANESKRTETFNTNLTSWNGKVDAACKKATDTASNAAQDAKTATDNATTAANKAEAAVAQLPLPLGNTLKGEAEATLVHVDDAYPAPLVTTKVLGQSNQQQEPAPSPENPQEITNLNRAELVITGRNLVEQSTTSTNAVNRFSSCLFVEADLMPSTNYVLSFNDVAGNGYYINEALFSNLHAFTTKSGRNVVKLSTKAEISKANTGQYVKQGWIILKNDKNQDKAPAFADVQIELGDTATAYEPHQSKSAVVDLKGNELCSVTDHRDELVIDSEGNVSLIKRVFSAHIDGLEPMSLRAVSAYQYFSYAPKTVRPIDGSIAIRSNRFGEIGREPWNFYVAGGSNAALFFTFPLETFANDGELNEWLKSNPIDVNYLGEQPQTIPLGKVELPALPEASSNVWNNGNIPANVYIQYLKDVNIAFADLESKLTQAVVAAAANL